MVVFQLNMNFGEFEWPWTSVLEGTVGVALVLLSTAAVLLFILLCWGIVWKLLLSRLGLFKALFASEKKPKPILRRSRRSLSGGKLRKKGNIRFMVPGEEEIECSSAEDVTEDSVASLMEDSSPLTAAESTATSSNSQETNEAPAKRGKDKDTIRKRN